jgi:serine protease AprX
MKKLIFLGLFLFLITIDHNLKGQIAPDRYYVQFTDKNNSPYSIDNPSAFLTERAIERRENQQISILDNDIPVNPQYLSGVSATGANLLFQTRWLNGVTIETSNQAVLDEINALPYVASIRGLVEQPLKHLIKEKDFFANESIQTVSSNNLKNGSSENAYNYGMGLDQITQINGVPLHNLGFKGEGMVIAILDGGFSEVPTHIAFDSLWAENRILGTKDFNVPGGDVFTESYHGTAVLSTIGSNVSGQLVGTAPRASFWLLRPEYVFSENLIEEYHWVSAAEFADSVGADVINSSLGYITFDMPQHDHTYEDMNGNTCIVTIGADIASSKGVLVVNSAGNSGGNASYPYVGAPADGFEVFSIGAVSADGVRAAFSSIGPTFDDRIKPDVMGRGFGTALASSNNSFGNGSGTSFSSPVIAGMSTCLWQANPTMTNMQIKDAIKQSADRASSPDVFYGFGIPDYMLAHSILTIINQQTDDEKSLIKVYPNPSNSFVKIEISNEVKGLSIYDLNGRLLIDLIRNGTVLTSFESFYYTLKSGVYVIKVSGESQTQTTKIIKQ